MHLPMVTWNTPEWRLLNGVDVKTRVPGFSNYAAMLVRCCDPDSDNYPLYGGRGIEVCERWAESFENFIADMGVRPGKEFSIDRIDPDGHYCPENCRWATAKEQGRNRRNNRLLAAFGETKPVSAWVDDGRCVVSKETIRDRINRGWAGELALTTPTASHYQGRGAKGAFGANEGAALLSTEA